MKYDLAECIFQAYRGAQRKIKGEAYNPLTDYNKFIKELRKEFIDEELQKELQKKKIEKGQHTWREFARAKRKKKGKVKF
jgi:hypothetical protein